MLIAAVLCLCAAAVTAGLGLWLLTRPRSTDPVRQVLRTVAPTQLAAAAMLAAGGAVALSARPQTGLFVVVVCVIGAVGTVGRGLLSERQGRGSPGGGSGLRGRLRILHAVL